MYDAALSHLLMNSFHCTLHRLTLYEAVQQFYYLACRDTQLVHGVQVLSDLLHSQPQSGAQVSYERGDTHAHSSLAYYLPTQIEWRIVPPLASRTPTLEHLVLCYLYWLGRGQLYHLPTVGKEASAQRVVAVGTLLYGMLHYLCGYFSAAGTILVFGSFAPLFLFAFVLGFSGVRFDARWWISTQVLKLCL